MKVTSAIFDLNGTILSDEDEYGIAFENVLKNLKVKIDNSCKHTPGIGLKKNWQCFIDTYNIKTKKTIEELGQETQKEYLKMFDKVSLQNGIVDFLEKLRKKHIKIGLATSNYWPIVEKVFDKFDIEKYFDAVTTVEEVVHTKPDPEIFLLSAQKLGIDPASCIVFEDSMAGVRAAKKAGMITAGIAGCKSHRECIKITDYVFSDFEKINFEKLNFK